MENLDQTNNKNVSLSLIAGYGASDSDSDDTETRSNNTGNDSDAAEISEMVLKNNIINACAHGPLSHGTGLDGETTRHMIIDSAESGVVEYDVTEYRDEEVSDSDSSSSNSSDSEVDSVKDIDESSGDEDSAKPDKTTPPKVQGELGLEDLPPIEDLAISLPEQECTKIGTVASVVDRLVIVRAFPQTPAVDLDSVLFLESGAKALGKVFDVFGPVTEPHYCVRFNSADHVKERGVSAGMDVYIAPRSQQHTNYVLLAQLMKMKGSDASWLHDTEPPPQHIEFSDDEDERRANRQRKEANRQRSDDEHGETSKNTKKMVEKRGQQQRPSEWSSRFGSGPSRGRSPMHVAGWRRGPAAGGGGPDGVGVWGPPPRGPPPAVWGWGAPRTAWWRPPPPPHWGPAPPPPPPNT